MKLIAILIALAGIRYLSVMQTTQRYNWFRSYAEKIQRWVITLNFNWASIAVIILPLLLALAIVQIGFAHWVWGLVGFVINAVVLWYCLSPMNLEAQVESAAIEADTSHSTEKPMTVAKPELQIQNQHFSRQSSEACLTLANENLFAVLFWFLVFGAFGAVLYRSVALLKQHAQKSSILNSLVTTVNIAQAILDWIPVRLAALSYVMAGDFVKGFAEWIKDVLSGLHANTTVLVKTGLAACGFDIDSENQADIEETRSVLRMIERATVVWLAIIAIFTLGAWIY
jgi:AmpE protein